MDVVSQFLYELHEPNGLYELGSISVLWTADHGPWTPHPSSRHI